jgi:hypothetical protein
MQFANADNQLWLQASLISLFASIWNILVANYHVIFLG